ncbi:MAG: exo-alpha-sialidase [Alistipes sp.]|nr:exo-alpha-sialidase [Alistipes sp.]
MTRKTLLLIAAVVALLGACTSQQKRAWAHLEQDTLYVVASQFKAGQEMAALGDSANVVHFVLKERETVPFSQSAIRQSTDEAKQGPVADEPFFTVRFTLPIPASYTPTEQGEMAGLDYGVFHHCHSPGFEVMPNGDALAVYFSSPRGRSESDTMATFVQARLRFGAEEWDMPELFFDTKLGNDQSGLLWNDNGKIWFFGGGRYMSDYVPFRIATSEDNGATWTFSVPQLDTVATDFTAQPINNAFRDPQGNIYMAMDADGSQSFLWRSSDEGVTWEDMGGRTLGRHSTIIPLDNEGTLLSIGGKNASVEGWTPQNISRDWGATWEEATPSPFPPLGSAQRPSMIRLQSGNLVYITDSYMLKKDIPAPEGWKNEDKCVIAISKDNGKTWRIKSLPVALPHNKRTAHPSLGYSTVRQAPNGLIHILTSANYPALHYELNEAWIWSDEGEIAHSTADGKQQAYSEKYPNGTLKSEWEAMIYPNGRYLLHGTTKDYYADGTLQHQVTYAHGRKTGEELFYNPDGTLRWRWVRDLESMRGVWTQYYPTGQKRVESHWDLEPTPRDLNRKFIGYVAEGPATHWNEDGSLKAVYEFVKGEVREN